MLETDDNRSATDSPDRITVRVRFLSYEIIRQVNVIHFVFSFETKWREVTMTLRTADGGRQPSGGAATKSSLCRSIASRKSSVPLRWTHLAPMYKVTFYVTAAELEVFLRSANGCEVLLSHVFFFSWYLYYRRLRCYSALQIRNSEKMQDCGFGAFVTLLMLERADKMLMKCRTSLAKIRSTHSLNFSQIHLDESIIYIHLRPRLVK